MARYVEAPENYDLPAKGYSIFLGGGITGCADWQKIVTEKLMPFEGLTILNPRRHEFVDSQIIAAQQIAWEHKYLKAASSICFWFSPETLCPITLFEYGKYLVGHKKLFVGCDPNYKRYFDICIQTKLERPNLVVQLGLEAMIAEIVEYLNQKCGSN